MKNSILKFIVNKYFITGISFLVWIMFFDQNDLFLLAERKNEVDQLEDNIKYLDVEINKMAVEYNALMNNSEVLEQYARETFKMKHAQEDVYVIEK